MNINFTYIVIVLVVILISMTLHELMHGYVAFWLGDRTAKNQGRLTFNPIKHLDPFLSLILPLSLALVGAPVFGGAKPVPFDPEQIKGEEWGVALVAIAGPVTNFLLAFIAFGIWIFSGMPTSSILGVFLNAAVMVNLGFFVFNLIPLPPLDGSRVLYALAPEFVRRMMEVIERFGLIIVFVFVLLGGTLLGTLMSRATAFFIGAFAGIFSL